MPSHSAKSVQQESQQEFRYWLNCNKALVIRPINYYATRQPRLENRRVIIRAFVWAALPIIVFAIAQTFLYTNRYLFPVWLAAPYLGILLWAYVQRFLLDKIFGKQFTFNQTLDLALTTAPVFIFAWIPTAGLVVSFLIACFWNYLGLSYQLKLDKGMALAAAALPIVVAGAATLLVGYCLMMLLYVGGGGK